ncbi:hypothetical protein H6503_06465 [Candidatus Woesearchaeota archaeon]|nr:hypothetical protein [Candidatus Woesearchaeota archaeon]
MKNITKILAMIPIIATSAFAQDYTFNLTAKSEDIRRLGGPVIEGPVVQNYAHVKEGPVRLYTFGSAGLDAKEGDQWQQNVGIDLSVFNAKGEDWSINGSLEYARYTYDQRNAENWIEAHLRAKAGPLITQTDIATWSNGTPDKDKYFVYITGSVPWDILTGDKITLKAVPFASTAYLDSKGTDGNPGTHDWMHVTLGGKLITTIDDIVSIEVGGASQDGMSGRKDVNYGWVSFGIKY